MNRKPGLAQLLSWTLAIAGCNAGGSTGPDAEWSLNGTWRGGFADGAANMSAIFTMSEVDTLIIGTGYISGSGIECGVTLEGTISNDRIRMDIICPGYLPIRYRGNQSGARLISGYVLGSGIQQNDMDLTKQ